MPRIGLEFVLRHADGTRDPLQSSYPWYALIEIASQREDGAAGVIEALLTRAVEAELIADAAIAASLGQAKAFWHIREMMSEVQLHEGGSIKSDVSVPVAHLPEFLHRATEAVLAILPESRPLPFGHYGDGNIHFNVSQPVGMDKTEFLSYWDSVTEAVNAIVLEFDGSISAEHGIGRMKRALLPRVKGPVEMDMMRAIKQVLDPKGILNPGKLL
jgi:FAD/FMN-containing dehydrogenase